MRLIVFFDLPVETSKNQRDYNAFHKYLIKNGFIMMQKSVYSKLAINNMTSAAVRKNLEENLPPAGVVQLLEITENQFSRIECLVGSQDSDTVDTMEKIVEL